MGRIVLLSVFAALCLLVVAGCSESGTNDMHIGYEGSRPAKCAACI